MDIALHYKPSMNKIYSCSFGRGKESKEHNLEGYLEFTNKLKHLVNSLENMSTLKGNSHVNLNLYSNGGTNSTIFPVINISAAEQPFKKVTYQVVDSAGVPDHVSVPIYTSPHDHPKDILDLFGKILKKHDAEIVLPEHIVDIKKESIYEIIKNIGNLEEGELLNLRGKYRENQKFRKDYPHDCTTLSLF